MNDHESKAAALSEDQLDHTHDALKELSDAELEELLELAESDPVAARLVAYRGVAMELVRDKHRGSAIEAGLLPQERQLLRGMRMFAEPDHIGPDEPHRRFAESAASREPWANDLLTVLLNSLPPHKVNAARDALAARLLEEDLPQSFRHLDRFGLPTVGRTLEPLRDLLLKPCSSWGERLVFDIARERRRRDAASTQAS